MTAPPLWLARQPSPEIAGAVDQIVGYSERGAGLAGDIEMASLVVPLVISFGEAFSITLGTGAGTAGRYASFTSGLFPGPVLITSTGRAACIQVNFSPIGAHRFFGMPMSEFSGRMVTLSDLGDRGFDALREKLGNIDDWGTRLDLVEAFVADRLRRGKPADPTLEWAYAHIRQTGGRVRIDRLAAHLGYSRKHLSQRFGTVFGLGPKSIARMVRFHGALAMAQVDGAADWADIAFACGYSDQAHLTRDFSGFSGSTPARWLATTTRTSP